MGFRQVNWHEQLTAKVLRLGAKAKHGPSFPEDGMGFSETLQRIRRNPGFIHEHDVYRMYIYIYIYIIFLYVFLAKNENLD
jgi:hypothetical protein